MMQDGMMDSMWPMMLGMGIGGLLLLVAAVLLIAALIKYLFFGPGGRR